MTFSNCHLLLFGHHALFLIFAMLAARCVGHALVDCLPHDRSSLLDLKSGFKHRNKTLVSWKNGSNCCDWEGVTCDLKYGHVVGLDLSGHNIHGVLSASLFNLTSLQTLNLADNHLHGSFTQMGFEELTKLMHLNLSGSGLRGQIPIGISGLTRLISLDLTDPYGVVQLQNPNLQMLVQNLNNLRELHLDYVNMSSDLDWSKNLSTSMPQLQVLTLSNCDLTGLLPKDILTLKNLMTVDFTGNSMLSGVLPDFAMNSPLKTLRLSGTKLSGNLPNSLGNLKYLTNLVIINCGMTGAVPSSIANLTQIATLQLAHNSLSGSIPLALLSHPTLELLHLSDNQFTGQLGEISNPSPSLTCIDLSRNQLQGPIPSSLFELPALRFLDLAFNDFNGTVELDMAWRHGNLTGLNLSHNRLLIEEASNNSFTKIKNLTFLGLASCSLTTFPSFLGYQTQIQILDLSDNMIGGNVPNWIWSSGLQFLNLSNNLFKHLEVPINHYNSDIQVLDLHSNMLQGPFPFPPPINYYLDYSNNNFSSTIPFNISFYLRFTSIFLFSNNNLRGEIPMSICEADQLVVIDFSYNNLSGSIPPCLFDGYTLGSFMQKKTLRSVNIRRNQLQGTIPHNITQVCPLESLDLNGNQLEGSLPRSLANCSLLNVLDLGNNHLVDSFPLWLGNITTLRVLILRENRFYGPIAPTESHCGNCTFSKLQVLDLSSNYFNGSLLSKCFSMLKVLKNYGLNYSTMGLTISGSLTESGVLIFEVSGIGYSFLSRTTVSSLAFLPHMNALHYSTDQYYQAPISVTNKGIESTLRTLLSIYMSVDFSNNAFEGEIPDVIGKLQGLQALNLSHNSLIGKIPTAIGNIKQLESLDLSGNHLSGVIPQEMTSLTFLSWLNLSDNNLVGRIPQSNQFSTFPNTSFEGNQGLCGRPLSKNCSDARPNKTVTAPPSKPDSSYSTYVIELGLSVGLGFGVGIAVILVLQNVSWKFLKSQNTSQQ